MKKFLKYYLLISAVCFWHIDSHAETKDLSPQQYYEQMQRKLATGWNTWDTRSALTHVLLPYGAAIDLHVIDGKGIRKNSFTIGSGLLHAGPHTYDGKYTDISLRWNDQKLRIESSADSLENIIRITPLEGNNPEGKIIVVLKGVWQRDVKIQVNGQQFQFRPGNLKQEIKGQAYGKWIKSERNEITFSTQEPVTICCGSDIEPVKAQNKLRESANRFVNNNKKQYGDDYEVYNAMQNVLSWDNIYDPTIRKVITPVSRDWNINWSSNPNYGGFVLFCWDSYFAAMMFSAGNRELAYANAVEITKSSTESGFVPNFYSGNDYKSRDRSQPPVGSLAVWSLYKKYGDKWLLELLYPDLIRWNRWWDKNRNIDGLLCWGSSPYPRVTYRNHEYGSVNNHYGGCLESGLDNSHMFDNVPFDTERHMLLQNDVGLSSLYIMDCKLLALIAQELGYKKDVKELRKRAKQYSIELQKLWDEEEGLYYNQRTDTGKKNPRISPTNFYPMLANIPSQTQAERMVKEHLMNPQEFWGEWVIPATPRNDPAFKDNDYWRGRIWAPLNFLVYMGLQNYDLPEVRKAVAQKSKALLLKEWLKDGSVYENYDSVLGEGPHRRSDRFYHWGALLSYIALIEDGYIAPIKIND